MQTIVYNAISWIQIRTKTAVKTTNSSQNNRFSTRNAVWRHITSTPRPLSPDITITRRQEVAHQEKHVLPISVFLSIFEINIKKQVQNLKKSKNPKQLFRHTEKKSTFVTKIWCAHTAVVPHDNPRAKPMTSSPPLNRYSGKGKISIKVLN